MLQGGTIGLVSVAKIRIIPKFKYILEYQNVLVFPTPKYRVKMTAA